MEDKVLNMINWEVLGGSKISCLYSVEQIRIIGWRAMALENKSGVPKEGPVLQN